MITFFFNMKILGSAEFIHVMLITFCLSPCCTFLQMHIKILAQDEWLCLTFDLFVPLIWKIWWRLWLTCVVNSLDKKCIKVRYLIIWISKKKVSCVLSKIDWLYKVFCKEDQTKLFKDHKFHQSIVLTEMNIEFIS